ncbi:MAG: M13 family metallopeptidase [Paludibacteraceae bacterium]|nr:M13 family metallopeptidase [Paludibacteraceae bacterium]
MKKLFFLTLATMAMIITGCDKKAEDTLGAGILEENMDTTVQPGVDFYNYATGGWQKLHPLTAEYSRFGSFDLLAENNREQLRQLIDEIVKGEQKTGTEAQKIKDLYNAAMDSTRRNAEGVEPLAEDLAAIAEIKTAEDFARFMGRDVANLFFGMYVDADIMNAKQYLLYIIQAGIGMGERDYYLDNDAATTKVRDAYVPYMAQMLNIAGVKNAEAQAKAVYDLEYKLAIAHSTNVELRDDAANYHLYTIEQLKDSFPGFAWDVYFAEVGVQPKQVNIGQPKVINTMIEILAKTPVETLKSYATAALMSNAAGYLSDSISDIDFAFFGKVMSGKEQQQPRWKRATSMVNGQLGMALGHLYCDKFFPQANKDRMETLVANLKEAYKQRIQNLDWMGADTKTKALEKIDAIYVKVGFPKTWRDYSSVGVDANDTYWAMCKKLSKFNAQYEFSKLDRPEVDKDEWLMTPQTVNAYYNPTTNEICFPAGILQYPFFDMSADDAFNYGAIGVVIGHEMTHGFDDQGSKFDKNGNFNDWWTAEDRAKFTERTKVMENYFNNIVVIDTIHANGAFTLGENIADHGGLQVAYQAFCNATKDAPLADKFGLTAAQRFFIAYANVWAGNIRDEEIILRTKSDPHSLGRWRVNGALPHINAWYEAFGIKEGDPLYLAPEKRVSIW